MTGADESYLLAEDLLGLSAPIQFLWVFETDPGEAAVERLRDSLAHGPLHRAVDRTRVPAARHRWVRSDAAPVPSVPGQIGAGDVGAWAEDRLRAAALRPAEGVAWRLDSATIESGGRVVSLLVSHMVADGQGVHRALALANSGQEKALPESVDGVRRFAEDVVDAARQLVASAGALRVLVREAIRHRGGRAHKVADERPARALSESQCGPDTTLAIVDIDRDSWHACAAEHGGTANTLFTALLAGVIARSGYPVKGDLRVCIAVDNRAGDPDDRANASGGVWIRLPDEVESPGGLERIRALSKQAFIDYAESGAEQVADNLAPVVRLMPKRLIAKSMVSIAGPDTTVSNLGVAPPDSLQLGGVTASSFGIRAIMQGMPVGRRRDQGPAIASWAVEYGERVTLTFFGIHPDHFGDADVMRKLIGDELSCWRIEHRFW
ncbi:hypothetical protein AAFP35_20285 [Gordonia sp. CPCC 206044]|uniref:hypothetical protein n=1 Tax=Gordonia sp. CPCC 206044 TaxID=3140793 RepID=UPI003AF3C549